MRNNVCVCQELLVRTATCTSQAQKPATYSVVSSTKPSLYKELALANHEAATCIYSCRASEITSRNLPQNAPFQLNLVWIMSQRIQAIHC